MSCELRPFRCSCSGISPGTASPESRCKLGAHRIKRTASATRASGETRDKQRSGEGNRCDSRTRAVIHSIKSANETEGHLLSTRDLDLFPLDEWHKFTAETIEIRKTVYTYREKVI